MIQELKPDGGVAVGEPVAEVVVLDGEVVVVDTTIERTGQQTI